MYYHIYPKYSDTSPLSVMDLYIFKSGQLHLTCMGIVKVNGQIFKGSKSAIFISASFLIRGQLFKERICSSRSKFFPLRVDPSLEVLRNSGSKQEVTQL